MDLQTQKLYIIAEVMQSESNELLAKVAKLFRKQKNAAAAADDLPLMPIRSAQEMQTRYEQSLRELDNGEGIPHEQVVALLQQRFGA